MHKPVNITRPLEECSAVKRLVNHWMHKPVNIRRRLNFCAICMPKMPIAFSALKPTISFSFCFNILLCSLHNHSSVFWRSSTTFRLVNTTEPVKNARNRHENDVYSGPSLCFVSHNYMHGKCYFCHSHRYTWHSPNTQNQKVIKIPGLTNQFCRLSLLLHANTTDIRPASKRKLTC